MIKCTSPGGTCNYVSWNDTSSNEDGFILWRMDSDWEWEITNAGLKKNWYYYNDCKINSSQTYTYAITSFNRAWASAFSNQVSTLSRWNNNFWAIENTNTQIDNMLDNMFPWVNFVWPKVYYYNSSSSTNYNNWNYANEKLSTVPNITKFVASTRNNWTLLSWESTNNPNYFEIYRNNWWNWVKVADVSWNYRNFFDNWCQDWVSSYAIRAWNWAKLSDISTRNYWNWIYATYSNNNINTSTPSQNYNNYNNWQISNFVISTTSSQDNYSTITLSWNYNWNNPNTYFVLERKSEWNDFEPVANVEFYQNQNNYSYKTTISYNINYTYRLRAYTNGQYSNSLTADIYKAQAPKPAPVVNVPVPAPTPTLVCWDNGCNKCNGQEWCLPDFYFGKCYYDEDKDLLYVDICNWGSDYDFGYYSRDNFLYYYNNLTNQTFNDIFKWNMRGWKCETKSFKVWTSYVRTNMSGPFTIKLKLDSSNYIQETNERNNEFVYTIR